MAQPISPVGSKHCNNMSSPRFDTPQADQSLIFLKGEYKRPKRKSLIRARQNPSSPLFRCTALNNVYIKFLHVKLGKHLHHNMGHFYYIIDTSGTIHGMVAFL